MTINAARACLLSRAIGLLVLPALLVAPLAVAQESLRVGVYHNPPKLIADDDQRLSGIMGELLIAMAEEEQWELIPFTCEFQECLRALELGELDLLPDVAWTSERAELFAYHQEPAMYSWSQLYQGEGEPVEALFDLEDKRVAVVSGSVQERYLRNVIQRFAIEVQWVGVASFAEGFLAVQQGQADVAASNHLFGVWRADEYGLHETSVIFQPMRLFYLGAPNIDPQILARIDAHLVRWKENPESIYFEIMSAWNGQRQAPRAAHLHWGWWALGLFALLAAVALGIWAIRRRELSLKPSPEFLEMQSRTHYLAYYDALTGLPNRRFLIDSLRAAIDRDARVVSFSAVLVIDLDNFSRINDTQGHDSGDCLLVSVAEQLRQRLADQGIVARLSSDEFAVLVSGLGANQQGAMYSAEGAAEQVLEAVSQLRNGHAVPVGASIGIALFNGHDPTTNSVLQQADIALQQAKRLGGNRFAFFNGEMQASVLERASLEADLHHALARDELSLHYQVQVDHQGATVGVEALLRWQHPRRGWVAPDIFVPLAEETGLIVPIGHWVLASACQLLGRWAQSPIHAGLSVSVNVSAVQFQQADFVRDLEGLLAQYQAPPGRLMLEVTESLLMREPVRIRNVMLRLRSQGVRFALDDFGTGFSSLSYLKRLPLDELKIDQSFIRDLLNDKADAAIVDTTILLAVSLGLTVVAEGVETQAQFDWLKGHGCYRYQGYLFGRPVPLDALFTPPEVTR